ncbi:uncharacterized protein [Anabrus simplex]|uniref:uncharacterized protein isoform X2 n=1 Tax=Anabrus simplex TaxID=316456 RepID=UPI0034DCF03F
MPLTQREALQLGLLLLCVPAQYLLSGNLGSGLGRSQAVLHLVSDLRHLRDSWFQLEPWKSRWLQFVSWLLRASIRPSDFSSRSRVSGPETSLAIEVLQYRERAGHFATSQHVRSERPDHLQFRVGQVVRHRTLGYRAVIVGWDLEAKAPESWLTSRYGDSKIQHPDIEEKFSYFDGAQYIPLPKLRALYPRD